LFICNPLPHRSLPINSSACSGRYTRKKKDVNGTSNSEIGPIGPLASVCVVILIVICIIVIVNQHAGERLLLAHDTNSNKLAYLKRETLACANALCNLPSIKENLPALGSAIHYWFEFSFGIWVHSLLKNSPYKKMEMPIIKCGDATSIGINACVDVATRASCFHCALDSPVSRLITLESYITPFYRDLDAFKMTRASEYLLLGGGGGYVLNLPDEEQDEFVVYLSRVDPTLRDIFKALLVLASNGKHTPDKDPYINVLQIAYDAFVEQKRASDAQADKEQHSSDKDSRSVSGARRSSRLVTNQKAPRAKSRSAKIRNRQSPSDSPQSQSPSSPPMPSSPESGTVGEAPNEVVYPAVRLKDLKRETRTVNLEVLQEDVRVRNEKCASLQANIETVATNLSSPEKVLKECITGQREANHALVEVQCSVMGAKEVQKRHALIRSESSHPVDSTLSG
jgi:hypothetical protein